jgi:hypothetical protein
MNVECGTDTEEDRWFDPVDEFGHPSLLLWCAQADPDEVGFGLIDGRDDLG